MYRTIAIAASVAVALGIVGALAATDAEPADPQIAHIAYTAGLLDIEAGKQALDKSKNEDGDSDLRWRRPNEDSDR
jgi:putative membrane protein